eukprot:jgi/Chrzof1/7718/Cz02g34040.t1
MHSSKFMEQSTTEVDQLLEPPAAARHGMVHDYAMQAMSDNEGQLERRSSLTRRSTGQGFDLEKQAAPITTEQPGSQQDVSNGHEGLPPAAEDPAARLERAADAAVAAKHKSMTPGQAELARLGAVNAAAMLAGAAEVGQS